MKARDANLQPGDKFKVEYTYDRGKGPYYVTTDPVLTISSDTEISDIVRAPVPIKAGDLVYKREPISIHQSELFCVHGFYQDRLVFGTQYHNSLTISHFPATEYVKVQP